MTVMAGRQAIMEICQAEGVDYIFGNPGTTELGFMDILQDYPQLQYIVCLHESIALGAAQMYANACGKTGVVNLHVAPGLGNSLGALYNAAIGKMPLIVTQLPDNSPEVPATAQVFTGNRHGRLIRDRND